MPSGKTVYREIARAYEQLSKDCHQTHKNIKRAESQLTSLLDSRKKQYLKLAKVYLPELTTQSAERMLGQLRHDITKIYRKKEDRGADIEKSLRNLTESRQRKAEEIEAITEELDERAEERDRLSEIVEKELLEKPHWETLNTQVRTAQQRLAQNEVRV